MSEQCAACRFFKPDTRIRTNAMYNLDTGTTEYGTRSAGTGSCHRFPPSIQHNERATFADTRDEWWCGEFQPNADTQSTTLAHS